MRHPCRFSARAAALAAALVALWRGAGAAPEAALQLNELEYLEMPGLNVMLAHDYYPDGHQGGVGIIQNGRRVATNGDLRLDRTPGQWQPVPKKVGERVTNRASNEVSVRMQFPDEAKDRRGFNPIEYPPLNFAYTVRVHPEPAAGPDAFRIIVDLEEPLAEEWVGRVGFNLELFPGLLFGRSWLMDGQAGIFPRQANGPGFIDANGDYQIAPLATGKRLTVAPEAEASRMSIEDALGGGLELVDGRGQHNNGWFVVRSLLAPGASARAVDWLVRPHAIPGWMAAPVIQVSQVGYHPQQPKIAVVELDRRDHARPPLVLARLREDGGLETVLQQPAREWGRFLRFNYLQLDFTTVEKPGLYVIRYGGAQSHPFRIGADVFARHVWQPTLEYFLPVQMCHMRVNDRYRVWHGLCHLDDALMAPINHNHFDGYAQGPSTLTRFAPGEHVPGLDRGGWHDAGDDDLRVESQAATLHGLALAWEEFRPAHDNTTIDQENRVVEIHRPDGRPDILQQIEHGALSVVGGHRALGRLYRGIITATLRQYVLLGDPANVTDNRVAEAPAGSGMAHQPEARPDRPSTVVPTARLVFGPVAGADDRWVFTEKNPRRELQVAAGLAAAARALRGYNDPMSDECRALAVALWDQNSDAPGALRVSAAVELLLATGERRFAGFLLAEREGIVQRIAPHGWMVARSLGAVADEEFTRAVTEALRELRTTLDRAGAGTPYGVPYKPDIWGAGWGIQQFGMQHYFLHKALPREFTATPMLRALDFILGCHPGENNASFASGVGARSTTVAYGFNRADWSYIPGGSASGTALIRPDFPELLEWPYLWQQTEYVLGGGTTDYVFLVLAAHHVLNRP